MMHRCGTRPELGTRSLPVEVKPVVAVPLGEVIVSRTGGEGGLLADPPPDGVFRGELGQPSRWAVTGEGTGVAGVGHHLPVVGSRPTDGTRGTWRGLCRRSVPVRVVHGRPVPSRLFRRVFGRRVTGVVGRCVARCCSGGGSTRRRLPTVDGRRGFGPFRCCGR